jgi:alpha-L-fucosidase
MSFDPYENEAKVKGVVESGQKVVVEPTPAQRRFMDLKFGLFIHFGINTFNDAEWSKGDLSPATYNPAQFDADQWASAAKAAGVGYILLVTKHHDGFCNWDTRWTDYCVRNTPFGRDVVGLVADAARKAGIKLALYYSLWDTHEPSYANDHGYAIYMKRQLAELLTRYGEIVELWFDGGWKKGGVDYQDADRRRWREIYEHIKSIQPDCIVGNNGTTQRRGEIVTWPCDVRYFEKGVPPEDDKKVYYCGGLGDYLPAECQYTLSKGGTGKGMFPSGKWFWHADDATAQDPQWVVDQLNLCNSRGANFVINAGPDNRGLLRDVDVECLRQVGKIRGIR